MNSILFDWKIRDIERTANEAKNRLHEIDSLLSNVDRLEHTVRETRAEVVWLRAELQTCQEKLTRIESRLDELSPT